MNLTPEEGEQVAAELKRFGADLQLTDDQKAKLQEFLTEARAKVADYLKANPNAKKSDIISQVAANRDQLRQRLVNFLNPEQLKKWDAEVGKRPRPRVSPLHWILGNRPLGSVTFRPTGRKLRILSGWVE